MQTSALLKTTVLRSIVTESYKSAVRNIGTSPLRRNSFKVQDQKDFQERVTNSKVPVIVDFFATYVI
jgi:thioredoxin 1